MLKLNQVIAIVTGRKATVARDLTEIYQGMSKIDLLSGLHRIYRPSDEENGEKLPVEAKAVQITVKTQLARARAVLTRSFDMVATMDCGNQTAKADITVDGTLVAKDVPVCHLLFLEKQLTDLHTVFHSIPVLSPERQWVSQNDGTYKSDMTSTIRTKKVPKVLVRAPATTQHQAVTELMNEDIIVGYYDKVDTSGAMLATDRTALIERCRSLIEAVKKARETANNTEVTESTIGTQINDYLFG